MDPSEQETFSLTYLTLSWMICRLSSMAQVTNGVAVRMAVLEALLA